MEVLGRETDNTYKWFKPCNHPALVSFQKVIYEDIVGQVNDAHEVDNLDLNMDLAERTVDTIE